MLKLALGPELAASVVERETQALLKGSAVSNLSRSPPPTTHVRAVPSGWAK